MVHLNYTDRKRISADHVELELAESGTTSTLSARLHHIDKLDFPPDAVLVLEAQRRYESMREPMGTVAAPVDVQELELDLFDSLDGVSIRLKVVAADGSGLLLGVADRLKAADRKRKGRRSLLPFRASHELGEEVWRLDFSGDFPIVLINAALPDWNGLARSPIFIQLVYPELLRQIATWALGGELDDEDSPRNDWLIFLRGMGLPDDGWEPEDADEVARLADDVVARFCREHKLMTRLAAVETD